jgi:hypothetical protein
MSPLREAFFMVPPLRRAQRSQPQAATRVGISR